jgi:hypothetical protein
VTGKKAAKPKGAGVSGVPATPTIAQRVAQLADYYRPQSPLEHLQILRIARCAAQLDTLHAAEQAKLELARLQSQASPAQIMLFFAHYSTCARRMALQIIEQTEAPPFGLTDPVLDLICLEISNFTGALDTEAHLADAFPVLCQFLRSTTIQNYDGPFALDHRLWAVATLLQSTLLDAAPALSKKDALVDQLLRKIYSEQVLKDSLAAGVRPLMPGVTYLAQVRRDFSVFTQLQDCRRQARAIAAQFGHVKALVAASAAMPTMEADRIMRERTSLERQLSRAVAELLQLQAQTLARLRM